MRDKLRTLEDQADDADESLRKMEADLRSAVRAKAPASPERRRPVGRYR